MENRQFRSILSQFKSFKTQADKILKNAWELDDAHTQVNISLPSSTGRFYRTLEDIDKRIDKLRKTAYSLIESYNSSIYDVSKLTGIKLKNITYKDMESALNKLIVECNTIIGALEEEVSFLSSKELEKQKELRREVNEVCKNLDPNFEDNLNEALTELENGHFLASALITSRVIDYTLKQLKLNDKKEIKDLIKIVTNEKSDTILKQQTEKISRLSRNLYNHRIDRFAKISDAFSLLSDCIFLLSIYENKLEG